MSKLQILKFAKKGATEWTPDAGRTDGRIVDILTAMI